MASIQPHGTGFRVHYTDKDGKRCKSQSFDTREAAEVWLKDTLPTGTKHLFAWIDEWVHDKLVDVWVEGKLVPKPTPYRVDAGHRLLAAVRRQGWSLPERIRKDDLKAWAKKDPGYRMPAQYLLTILRWMAKEHQQPIAADVLAWRPEKATRQAPMALLTDAQVEAIRDCAFGYGVRAFAVIDYLLTYGARPITACRLRQSDLDVDAGDLVLPNEKRSGGWRHVVQADHLAQWQLLAIPGDDGSGPLFPHYLEDRPWRITAGRAGEITTWYKNTIAKRLKLGSQGGIYNLKRWSITRMLRAGIDPATVARFTGHLDVNQVLTYAKSNADLQTEALAKLASLKPRSQERSQVPKLSS